MRRLLQWTALAALVLCAPDALAQNAGPATATIHGTVVADDTSAPIPGARVHLSVRSTAGDTSGADHFSRLTTTGADGRFTFSGIPAGRVGIGAIKEGYYFLGLAGTDASALARGTPPLTVADGDVVDAYTIRLGRGGSISGRVVDQRGEPASGVTIEVLRRMARGARSDWMSTGGQPRLDETGSFHVGGLPPGEYIVGARPGFSVGGRPARSPERDGSTQTYYPGTTTLSEAAPVVVHAGEDTAGIVFEVVAARLASVRGRVLRAGADETALPVSIMVSRLDKDRLGSTGAHGARAGAGGTFEVSGLAPGRYRLSARETRNGPWDPPIRVGVVDVDVDGEDLSGVAIALRTGSTLTGRVVDTAGQAAGSALRVEVVPEEGDALAVYAEPVAVNADGTFTVANVFGRGSIRLRTPDGNPVPKRQASSTGLTMTAVHRGGADVTGRAIHFDGSPIDVTIQVTGRAR